MGEMAAALTCVVFVYVLMTGLAGTPAVLSPVNKPTVCRMVGTNHSCKQRDAQHTVAETGVSGKRG